MSAMLREFILYVDRMRGPVASLTTGIGATTVADTALEVVLRDSDTNEELGRHVLTLAELEAIERSLTALLVKSLYVTSAPHGRPEGTES